VGLGVATARRLPRELERLLMRAVVIHSHGPPEVLEQVTIPVPTPGPGQALLRVRAVSVNAYLDVSNRAGCVPFASYTFPHVLGAEHAAEIVALHPGTQSGFAVGDRVVVSSTVPCRCCKECLAGHDERCAELGILGVNCPGAYAEYTALPIHVLRRIPEGVEFADASALGLNGPLAVAQLSLVNAQAGETILVQGAASASGSMALLVARVLGLKTIGTTRNRGRAARIRDLGFADHVVVTDSEISHAVDSVNELTDGRGADIVIDNLGAMSSWPITVGALAVGGRVVTSGAKFGQQVTLDLRNLYTRSQTIFGIRTANEPARDRLWQMVEHSDLRPVIDSTFPLEEAASAHQRIEAGDNIGRVVLTV